MHGPQPRSYDYAFPRKKLLGALRSALAAKLADGKLVVVESFELKEAKTKTFRQALDKLNAKGKTLLVENGGDDQNLHLSSRNLKGVELVAGNQVHPYHLLRYEQRGVFAARAGEAAGVAEELGSGAQAWEVEVM